MAMTVAPEAPGLGLLHSTHFGSAYLSHCTQHNQGESVLQKHSDHSRAHPTHLSIPGNCV